VLPARSIKATAYNQTAQEEFVVLQTSEFHARYSNPTLADGSRPGQDKDTAHMVYEGDEVTDNNATMFTVLITLHIVHCNTFHVHDASAVIYTARFS
jgi:hypothetical protein